MKKYSVLAFLVGILALVPITYAAPVSLSASATGQTSVSLSWTTDADITSHEVFYSTTALNDSNLSSAQSYGSMPMSVPNTSQSVSISGLNEGTTYYFAYKFIDTIGAIYISYTSVTTQPSNGGSGGGGGGSVTPPPTSVSGFTATPASTYVDLSWDTPASTVLSQFDIHYSTNQMTNLTFSSAQSVAGIPLPISSTRQSVRVDGLQAGTTYYFGIRTVNVVGEASNITYISSQTTGGSNGGGGGSIADPTPVTNLTATRNANTVTLIWDTPINSALSQFDIFSNTGDINESNVSSLSKIQGFPLPISGTRQSMTVSNVASTTNYFAIRTVNVIGKVSSLTVVHLMADTNGVLPVTNLVANSGSTVIDLAWDTPVSSNTSMFDVRCSSSELTSSNFTSAAMISGVSLPIPGTRQGTRISGLSNGTKYWCGVRVQNTIGEYSPIVFISATPFGGGGGGGGGGGSYSGGGGSSTGISSPAIVINNGAEKTDRVSVTLSLTAVNADEMLLSNSSDFHDARWEPFASTTQWILVSGNGNKIVYARFRNDSSSTAGPVSDSIILETPVPEKPKQEIIIIPRYEPVNTSRPYTSIISISPNATYIPSEDKVVVVLTAHPGDSRKYGAHLELDYPTETLELNEIEYGDGWVPEFDPIYNSDNKKDGRIIKTAAHSGFDQPINFATVVFNVKKSGSGILNTNSFTGLRELPEYASGLYETRASISTTVSNVGKTRLMFANLVSLTTQDNTIAVISSFIFLFLCYIAYVISLHRSGKRKLVFPLPLKK